jgi:hypothetical protein
MSMVNQRETLANHENALPDLPLLSVLGIPDHRASPIQT